MILACMAEVNVTGVPRRQQINLMLRLTQALRKRAPEHYAELVKLGNIESVEALQKLLVGCLQELAEHRREYR